MRRRRAAVADDDGGGLVDREELRRHRQLLGDRRPPRLGIVELQLHLLHLVLHLLQPRHVGVGQDLAVGLAELRAPRFRRPQLLLIARDLLLQEPPRIVHVGAVVPGRGLGKHRQHRLHHVLGRDRVGVLIGNVEQVRPLQPDMDVARQAAEQPFLVFRRPRLVIEIGQVDHLLQVRPAQERALHVVELLQRIGLHRNPAQERRQQAVDVDINARRGFIDVRDAEHRRPADRADEPADPRRDPLAPPDSLQVEKDQLPVHGVSVSPLAG